MKGLWDKYVTRWRTRHEHTKRRQHRELARLAVGWAVKLWVLRAIERLPPGTESPWEPWYDKTFGFVVRAETEADARALANANGSHETGPISREIYRIGGDPWLDPLFSTCEELTPEGRAEVILMDHRSA